MIRLATLVVAMGLFTAANAQKQELSLNLQQGSTYYHTYSSESMIKQEISGREINVKTKVINYMSFRVIAAEKNSFLLETSYDSMIIDMKAPMMVSKFNSNKNDSSDIGSMLLGIMCDSSFTIRMSDKGRIEEVIGIDSLWHHSLHSYDSLTPNQRVQFASILGSSFTESAVRSNLEMGLSVYPKKKVALGDAWTVDSEINSITKMTSSINYILRKRNDEEIVLEGSGVVETSEKDMMVNYNGVEMKAQIYGVMTMKISLDPKTGWIRSSEMKQEIDGLMSVDASQSPNGSMEIPVNVLSSATIDSTRP